MRFCIIASCWLASLVPAFSVTAQVPAAVAITTREDSCEGDTQAEIRGRFPSDQFIVGQGLVPSARDAVDGKARSQQAAMADISQQLETALAQGFKQQASENNGRASRSTSEHIETSTSTVLKNVQYQLSCYKAASRQYQTWATLNKRDAVSGASAALAELNERGQRLHSDAIEQLKRGRIRDALQRTADLRPMVIEALQHLKVLRALSASPQSVFLDEGSLRAFEQKARDSAPIYIDFSGQPLSTDARTAVASELVRRGLPVVKSSRGSAFHVHAHVSQLSSRHSELAHSTIVELEANVTFGYTGQSDALGSLQVREKGSGANERVATLAAEIRLAKALGKGVGSELDKLLDSHGE